MLFDRQARSAFIIACVTLALCGVGFRSAVGYLNVYLKKEPIELRAHLATIPKTLGRWKDVSEARPVDAAVIETLGMDQYLDRLYVADDASGKGHLLIHIAYYTGMIDAVPHVPDRCFVAGGGLQLQALPHNYPLAIDRSGWREDPAGSAYPLATFTDRITGRGVTARMPLGDFKLRTTEFLRANSPDERTFAGYFFIANGRVTPTPEGVRGLAFDLSTKFAYYCKVQLVAAGPDLEAEPFVTQAADLLTELLPELMRCLPDWFEVETAAEGTSTDVG